MWLLGIDRLNTRNLLTRGYKYTILCSTNSEVFLKWILENSTSIRSFSIICWNYYTVIIWDTKLNFLNMMVKGKNNSPTLLHGNCRKCSLAYLEAKKSINL